VFQMSGNSDAGRGAVQRTGRFIAKNKLTLFLLGLIIAGGILPLRGQGPLRERAEHEKDSAQLIHKRAEWFFRQRAYPLKHIPAGVRIRALEQARQMREERGTFMQRFLAKANLQNSTSPISAGPQQIAVSMSNWTPIGPQPTTSTYFNLTSGRVVALAVDPCDSTGNTIYAGGAQGGLWKTTNGGTSWTPMTDSQLSLASGAIAVDPVLTDCTGGHTGAIYYGTGEENFAFDSFYGAGVLTSHDGGNTWTKDNTFVSVTSGTPSVITPTNQVAAGPYIGNLAVDPATSSSSQVLLAGVQGVSSPINSGIYRSTNGGANWTRVLPVSGMPAANDFGTGVVFDPADPSGNTAYAALGIPFCAGANGACGLAGDEELDNGVYKSTDGGQTWTLLSALDNAAAAVGGPSFYGRITIAVGPPAASGQPGELIVAIANIQNTSSNLLGLFKSTDGGNTFSMLMSDPSGTSGFCDQQCFYDMSIGISPGNPQLIFLGGGPAAMGTDSNGNPITPQCGNFGIDGGISTVIRSTDGGNTWNDVSCDNSTGSFIHVDTHAFAFSPNGQLYTGNDGGIWSSSSAINGTAGSQSWTDLNSTLNLTQFYPGNSIHPSNPQIAYAGSQDNGTQMFSGSLNWNDTAVCGDGGWTDIDPSTPSTIYAACAATGQFEVNKNQFDGVPGPNDQNWLALDSPGMDSDNQYFIPPLVLDPTNPQNLYFGTFEVWQSMDGGISWNIISPDLTGSTTNPNCVSGSCVITTMSVAPSDSNTVYVGTDIGAIWASTNATSASPTFSEIDQANTPGRVVTQIVASPTNSQVAFAAFSGFSGFADTVGHLFETTNGGQSWTDISCHASNCGTPLSTDLPNTPVNDVVVDPNDLTNSTLYVATDVGVFATSNDGATWSELATGLPHVECTSLKLDENARVLQVGTHGRGVWDLQLPGLPASALTGILPVSASAGSSGATLTLTGQGLPTNGTVNFGTTQLAATGGGTQLTVSVPASALASSGVISVSVSGAQNSLNFSIEGPVPVLQSASPGTITAGANATLTVTGANFTPNSEVIWTPQSGTNKNVSTALAQNSGGTSSSFTVTVPASLLTATVGNAPPAVFWRRPRGPAAPWLIAALCILVLGIAMLIAFPRKRRGVIGATVGMVLLLLFIGGCSNGSSSPPPFGFGSQVQVYINVYNPAPGGGVNPKNEQQATTVTP